jgi:hypothetical protein
MKYEQEKQELAEYRSQQRDLRKRLIRLESFYAAKVLIPIRHE